MLTKTKLALAVMGSLIAGGIGLAAAQGITTPQPDQTAQLDNAGGGGFRARMLAKYDTNNDGKLEPNERAAMRADMKAKREARHDKMLAKWDANGDGKLEPNERAAMRQARAEKTFKRLDANNDGVLSLQEFEQAKMFRGHRFMRGGFGGGFSGNGGGATGGQP
ncbi:MAG TPA: EF-hand domain-containing protein [Kofleriaceae bacterium]|jgi:hypothetical protein